MKKNEYLKSLLVGFVLFLIAFVIFLCSDFFKYDVEQNLISVSNLEKNRYVLNILQKKTTKYPPIDIMVYFCTDEDGDIVKEEIKVIDRGGYQEKGRRAIINYFDKTNEDNIYISVTIFDTPYLKSRKRLRFNIEGEYNVKTAEFDYTVDLTDKEIT